MALRLKRIVKKIIVWTVCIIIVLLMVAINYYSVAWYKKRALDGVSEFYSPKSSAKDAKYIALTNTSRILMSRDLMRITYDSSSGTSMKKLNKFTNEGRRIIDIWHPDPNDDRILAQMNFIPNWKGRVQTLKKIFVVPYPNDWGVGDGSKEFYRQECPVKNCELTGNSNDIWNADAVVIKHEIDSEDLMQIRNNVSRNQVWIYFGLESPYVFSIKPYMENMFNWTATYRRDSTIVTPYEKFVPFRDGIEPDSNRNYAFGKSKKVAWIVSNCATINKRMDYVKELSQYISVDIYGDCGENKCPREEQERCNEMLNRDYKFYLSFENVNCRDYITEKFFQSGLQNYVIPIVMGAHPDDYAKVAPPHSYISVEEFKSPKHLAQYLHMLDLNDTLYNEYFRWKGSGVFINTKFWCRVCAMLNDDYKPTIETGDMQSWWSSPGMCTIGRWTSNRMWQPFQWTFPLYPSTI